MWDSTWTKQDECVFDISVGVDYNGSVNGREKKRQSYTFEYDIFGNVTSTYVGTRRLVENTYNNYGTLASVRYGNEIADIHESVSYTYDELDRLRQAEDSMWMRKYSYDGNGNVTRIDARSYVNAENITVKYEYDSIGRMIYSLETDGNGKTLRYVKNNYDSKNRLTGYSYYDGNNVRTESYTYNDNGTVKTFAASSTDTVTNEYDSLNRITKKTVKNGSGEKQFDIITNYTTEEDGKTSSLIKDITYDYPEKDDVKYRYEYDNLGNITRIYYRFQNNETTVARYAYDKQNQLILEEVHEGNTVYTLLYIYDTYGNIREVEKYQGDYYDYDEVMNHGILLDTVEYGYTDSTWLDLLTSYDGYDITYDGIGNPLVYQNGKSYSMVWDGRRLIYTGVDGKEISYGYDSEGRRNSRTVDDAEYTYLYEGDRLVRMDYVSLFGCTIFPFYDDGGNPLGFYFKNLFASGQGRKFYYVRNVQGDIVQIRNSEQSVVANYHYDAWGKLLSITDANGNAITAPTDFYNLTDAEIAFINPLRYRGYVYDNETGFYYLNSRYYDPKVGRFINADTVTDGGAGVLGNNLFMYAANNPVNNFDLSGHWSVKNAIKKVARNVKPVVKIAEKVLSNVNMTYSNGINISFSPSAFSFNLQGGVSIDTSGNVALQGSFCGGVTGGTPGLSITEYKTVTNAPNIDKLNGEGYQIGGSVGVPLGAVPVDVGIDFNIIPDNNSNQLYFGATSNVGVGASCELHVEWGETATWYQTQFNIFDVARTIYVKIMEW